MLLDRQHQPAVLGHQQRDLVAVAALLRFPNFFWSLGARLERLEPELPDEPVALISSSTEGAETRPRSPDEFLFVLFVAFQPERSSSGPAAVKFRCIS